MTLSGGIGWDSETTNQLGYTYYGSDSDWTGFDDGTRDIPPSLAAALASGKPILEGADFSGADLEAIAMDLVNAPTTLDRKSTRLNSSHSCANRMPSSPLQKQTTKH